MHDRYRPDLVRLTRRILITVAAMVLAAPAGTASAQTQLTPHAARYKIKISALSGELDTKLEATDNGFVATHEVRPTGLARVFSRGFIRESSYFSATDDGIRASRYQSQDTLSREHDFVDIRFDWDAGEARGTVNKTDFRSDLKALSHDRISIQYQLMYDLLNGVTDADYTIFEIDRLRPVTVRNIGSKTIDVPAGEYTAVGIQHQAAGSKRVTTLWCVEELGYLPAVIEQHREGSLKFRATLLTYRPAGALKSAR